MAEEVSIQDFQLLDLFDQQDSVKALFGGQSAEAQLNWLRRQGAVSLIKPEFPNIPSSYVFESRVGLRCVFCFSGDELIAVMKT
jgi:hypothetical protein